MTIDTPFEESTNFFELQKVQIDDDTMAEDYNNSNNSSNSKYYFSYSGVIVFCFFMMAILSTFSVLAIATSYSTGEIVDACTLVTCDGYICVALDREKEYICAQVSCYKNMCIPEPNTTLNYYNDGVNI